MHSVLKSRTLVLLLIFWGIQIRRGDDGSIALLQQTYINGLVESFEHAAARPVSTPIDASGVVLQRSKSEVTVEE